MFYYIGFIFYVIGIKLYNILLVAISPFNKRAKIFIKGREKLVENIALKLKNDTRKTIWFHVSSLGEFEQARPVIEKLRLIYSDYKYVITVYSPSGFETRKNDKIADYIFYLPNDSKKNAKQLVDLFNPEMVFWVKYDFWFFYLNELKKRNIPTYLIAASFNNDQIYFKFYGSFLKSIIAKFTYIFTQNLKSVDLLKSIKIYNSISVGDPRFDRVYETLVQTEELEILNIFKGNNLLIVLGSSYALEEKMLANFLLNQKYLNIKIVVAPHFIGEERLIEIENIFNKQTVRYSRVNANLLSNYEVLVIDNIGMLNKIYKYANISFIGGGFVHKGLHNILEAAVFGNAILYGNKISYFPEATEFSNNEAAILVENEVDFNESLKNIIENETYRNTLGTNAKELILKNRGATEKIISYISKK
ncbi:MAG: glycosyltransferase N-terminal domain-containing protein [Bacteroidota bacterium]|jgi:3-deoxy-D-manno-octulosonic-acid transferase